MDDLEMTELCAEAMGWDDKAKRYGMKIDPLHDDAQALALVKKFEMNVLRQQGGWTVFHDGERSGAGNADLNRAIVECVAKMQVAAPTRPSP